MLSVFRMVFGAVALLCLIDALLIVGSLSQAPRGPSFSQTATVSGAVAGGLLLLGLLAWGIRARLSRICEIERKRAGTALDADLGALLRHLALTGLVFAAILALGTAAIVQRIQGGLSVFG